MHLVDDAPIEPTHAAAEFRLSQIQSQTAELFAQEHIILDFAAAMGCGEGAVRWRTKLIYLQLSITWQSELVSMLLALPNPALLRMAMCLSTAGSGTP